MTGQQVSCSGWHFRGCLSKLTCVKHLVWEEMSQPQRAVAILWL